MSFMPRLKRVEPAIPDHSSIRTFKDCPRKYFYSMACGMQRSDSVIYLTWGTCYHKFREKLEEAYMGGSEDGKVDEAMQTAIEIWDKEQGKDPLPDTAQAFMTKARLLKSMLHAYGHWQKEKSTKAIEVIGVEIAFNVELPDGSRTSGRADQIVRWNRKLWGRDFKTSSVEQQYYSRTITPNDQFSRYTFAESQLSGEPVQGQIVEVLFNKADHKTSRGKSPTGPEIYTHIAARTKEEIAQWCKEAGMWNAMLAFCREKDVWPQNENHCRYCQYHEVCRNGDENSMQDILSSSMFTHRPWINTDV